MVSYGSDEKTHISAFCPEYVKVYLHSILNNTACNSPTLSTEIKITVLEANP